MLNFVEISIFKKIFNMECIYYNELKENLKQISIQGELTKHLKALRICIGEKIMLTNGNGLSAVCSLINFDKKEFTFVSDSVVKNHGELPVKLGLAMGILSDRNRFEFALEKAVELGCSDFYPLITKHSETKKINLERLKSKAVSSLEQCKRSQLIVIHEPVDLKEFCQDLPHFENIILADENGASPELTKSLSSCLCFVGPEGGFEKKEMELINGFENSISWSLGCRRLRAETAAISILSLASLKINFSE